MITINMQYFGGNGASSKKAGGGARVTDSAKAEPKTTKSATSTGGKLIKQGNNKYGKIYYGENDNGVSVTIYNFASREGYTVVRSHSPEIARRIGITDLSGMKATSLSEAKSYAKGWLQSRKTRDFV